MHLSLPILYTNQGARIVIVVSVEMVCPLLYKKISRVKPGKDILNDFFISSNHFVKKHPGLFPSRGI